MFAKESMQIGKIMMALYLFMLLMAGIPALASTTHWTNSSGGDWHTPSNWDDGVPTSADTAYIILSGTYTVTINSPAGPKSLELGGASGTQTLEVNDDLSTIFSWPGNSYQINVNGVLDVYGSVGYDRDFVNDGTIYIHTDAVVGPTYNDPTPALENNVTGLMQIDSGGSVTRMTEGSLNNGGILDADDAELGDNLSNFGSVYLQGDITVRFVTNDGLLDLARLAKVYVGDTTLGPGSFDNESGGTVIMRGGSAIDDIYNLFNASVTNNGTFSIQVDTNFPNESAIVFAYYDQLGGSSLLDIQSGKFRIYQSGNLNDSIYIADQCTLDIRSTDFLLPVAVDGPGSIWFREGTNNLNGKWHFMGNLLLRGFLGHPSIVNFNPTPPPNVHLTKLSMSLPTGLNSPYNFFNVANGDSVVIDTISQNGGTINGTVTVANAYDWTEGTLTADTASVFTIPAGVTLVLDSTGTRTLDSTELVIEGSAIMQDSGVFVLTDSAVVNIAPGGTLDVFGGFTMSGVGTLYNSGETTFDPQDENILIDVRVINSTIARTPGTIEILSRSTTFGEGGENGGDLSLDPDAELTIDGEFGNDGSVTVADGADLNIDGTFTNKSTGEVLLTGDAAIGGDGIMDNGGTISRDGTAIMSITNTPISPTLINRDDSGYVNILQDTLTLLSGGTNQGTITISAGAVLKVFGTFINDPTGIIMGSGVLDVSEATFTNNGTLSPGASPGVLTVNGNMILGSASILQMEMNGALTSQYDRILVSGSVQFDGILALFRQNTYIPLVTDTLRLLNYASHSGQFSEVTGTAIGNGQYFEIALGPTGLKNYVCTSGDPEISVSMTSISDTIHQTISNRDTFDISICNIGQCPLEYYVTIVSMSPPTPAWLTIASGDDHHIVTRTNCESLRLFVDVTGLAAGPYSGTIYISTNDPDESDIFIPVSITVVHGPDFWDVGGGNNDYATISAAVTFLNAATIAYPQVFDVYSGSYSGPVTINQISGASATNTITFRSADPNGSPPELTSSVSRVLRVIGTDHLIWDGIDLRRTTNSASSCLVDSASADSNVFRNFTIHGLDSSGTSTFGIQINRPSNALQNNDGLTFENIYVHGCGRGISHSSGLSAPSVSNYGNKVLNCRFEHAVIAMQFDHQRNLLISGNVIDLGWSGLFGTQQGITISSSLAGDTVSIIGNTIRGLVGTSNATAIFLTPNQVTAHMRVINNMISGGSGLTLGATGISVSGSQNTLLAYNSVNMSGVSGTVNALNVTGFTMVLSARNNIFVASSVSDTARSMRFSTSFVPYTGDFNCFHGTGPKYEMVKVGGGAVYPTLAIWTSASLKDSHSVASYPGFISPADLHMDSYYIACDSNAVPISGITTDIDGEPRNANYPDIGADEYAGIYDTIDSLTVTRVFGTNDIKLNWEDISGAQSYFVYSGTTSGFAINASSALDTVATSSYTHVGAVNDDIRFYRVRPSGIPVVAILERMRRPR